MAEIGQPSDVPASGPAAGAGPTRTSIWPSIHPRLLELIRAHRSTIVFVNGRRLAERLAAQLNELADEDLVRTHHGSIAREQRLEVEDALKSGRLRAIVATSAWSSASTWARSTSSSRSSRRGRWRAGCSASAARAIRWASPAAARSSRSSAATCWRRAWWPSACCAGAIEETRYPRNPLDVLAQQLVAMCAVDEWHVDELYAVVRRAANFADLSKDVFVAVLDLLAGRYPSDEFAELRPRLVWDRTADVVRAREGAGRLAITSGGTIPDRGLFGVFLPDGTRVGRARRGDGVRDLARARSSSWAPRAGGSRTSPATASWSPPPPANPARCRSGTATSPDARSSSAARSAPSRGSCAARSGPARSPGCAKTSASTPGPPTTWSTTLTNSRS